MQVAITQSRTPLLLLLLLLLLLCCCPLLLCSPSSPSDSHEPAVAQQTIIFGPGLSACSAAPERQFLIQLRDASGHNTSNVQSAAAAAPHHHAHPAFRDAEDAAGGGDAGLKFRVEVGGSGFHPSTEIVHLGFGLYRAVFMVLQPGRGLRIRVTLDGEHVIGSPVEDLVGLVQPEWCACPVPIHRWLQHMQCPDTQPQVEADIARLRGAKITKAMFNASKVPAHNVHYSIINNRLYYKVIGTVVDVREFVEAFMLSLLRKVSVPDVEFVINYSDYPTGSKAIDRPTFSMCGGADSEDFLLPTYDMMMAVLQRKHSLVTPCAYIPFDKKIDQFFWRGSDSNHLRFDFNRRVASLPPPAGKGGDFWNVGISHMIRSAHDAGSHGPMKDPVDFCEMHERKYAAIPDGSVAAYRFPFSMGAGSVIFKQESPYYEHFYQQLKPWVDYVPFKRDASDIQQAVDWAIQHPEECAAMVERNIRFFALNLSPEATYCYVAQALTRYSQMLAFEPRIRRGMEEVEQHRQKEHCECDAQDPYEEEEELIRMQQQQQQKQKQQQQQREDEL